MVSLICSLRHHQDEVSCCAFSPGLLATCSGDKTLRVYRTADFSELPFSPLSGHGYGVHCCCFSSCGTYLFSCSTDGSIMAWLSQTGACDGTVVLWDFPSRTLRRSSAVSEASVVACCFSPCGHMFVTGCTSGKLKLWDTDMNLLHAERDAHDLGVTCCSFAPQITVDECYVKFRLASCGQDNQLKIWIVCQHEGAERDLSGYDPGKQGAHYEACDMKLLSTLTSQSAPLLSCVFSSDGELIVSGSVDKSVAIYDVNLGTLLHTLKQHDRYVTAVASSPTMPWIATGSVDRSVNVWRIGDEVSRPAAESRQTVCQGKKLPGHCRLLVADWSEEDVQTWLCEEGLQELVSIFKANNIDGAELSQLNKDTAAELGIESVGLRGRLLRNIEALKTEQSGSDAPDEFLCPITRELMKDPVIASDGYSYERESIESWIRGKNKTSPMTNLLLQTTLLTPNRSLKMAITRWKTSQ